MAGSKRYKELLDEMWEMHEKKNSGYAGVDNPDPWANFRMSTQLGVPASTGAAIRRGDKYIRSVNLMKNLDNEQVGESRKDTLMDEAAYALIEICLLEEEMGPDPMSVHNPSDLETGTIEFSPIEFSPCCDDDCEFCTDEGVGDGCLSNCLAH